MSGNKPNEVPSITENSQVSYCFEEKDSDKSTRICQLNILKTFKFMFENNHFKHFQGIHTVIS